jgi:hypothetical protein
MCFSIRLHRRGMILAGCASKHREHAAIDINDVAVDLVGGRSSEVDCRQKLDAEADIFHRIGVPILDRRHRPDKLVVPALARGADRPLDQRIGLAE